MYKKKYQKPRVSAMLLGSQNIMSTSVVNIEEGTAPTEEAGAKGDDASANFDW